MYQSVYEFQVNKINQQKYAEVSERKYSISEFLGAMHLYA